MVPSKVPQNHKLIHEYNTILLGWFFDILQACIKSFLPFPQDQRVWQTFKDHNLFAKINTFTLMLKACLIQQPLGTCYVKNFVGNEVTGFNAKLSVRYLEMPNYLWDIYRWQVQSFNFSFCWSLMNRRLLYPMLFTLAYHIEHNFIRMRCITNFEDLVICNAIKNYSLQLSFYCKRIIMIWYIAISLFVDDNFFS